MNKQKKRAKCNNWRECPSVHCKHKHKHFLSGDCLEECDEHSNVKCEEIDFRKKNSGNKIRENKKTVEYRYVSDLDTKYSYPGRP